MAVWDELKVVLARLRDEQEPGTLQGYPDPRADESRRPPFRIMLAPWAAGVAADLYRRFGDDVSLMVGALSYPPSPADTGQAAARQPAELIDPQEVEVELDGAAIVRSGRTIRRHLVVRNRTSRLLEVPTNGQLTAEVADPRSGAAVGGFAGAHTLPLVVFRVPPGAAERIPLLIGTASFTPRLGYAIPPGTWAIRVELPVGSGRSPDRSTPLLPLTVTD
jgi:hypothetical protein